MSKEFIFIVGQHRTGSTLLKNILDAHSGINMAFDEMNLFEPFRKNTLDRFVEEQKLNAREVVGLIKGQKIYGTFWKDFEESRIDFDDLERCLQKSEIINSKTILKAILNLLRKKKGSIYSGVKYPVHARKVDFLISHFPDAKIIFLTRNPSAIIASKLNDEATRQRKNKSWLHRFIIHYFTILYFAIEYIISINAYEKFKDHVKLIQYEHLVTEQSVAVRALCKWLEVEFDVTMLNVSGKKSSHDIQEKTKVHGSSLDRYKKILNIWDRALIWFLTAKHFKKLQA
ncbi:sulfotransferase family protein [Rhodohalobacter mucosus]|uniref:Sulfotransferase family protein n=1 Tax=Rhodohalobacter mucosus TaxID=2079485 RepID=A0A316U2J3_9BACT|nr:sulfotransferase [Rhodohalobacter mucosus]PWN07466.1 hypothetical protein DDZ15_04170 [Rhodohalobacter mucosus]